jgi:hypothetical protein
MKKQPSNLQRIGSPSKDVVQEEIRQAKQRHAEAGTDPTAEIAALMAKYDVSYSDNQDDSPPPPTGKTIAFGGQGKQPKKPK